MVFKFPGYLIVEYKKFPYLYENCRLLLKIVLKAAQAKVRFSLDAEKYNYVHMPKAVFVTIFRILGWFLKNFRVKGIFLKAGTSFRKGVLVRIFRISK
jgi:hypothetical protein